LSGSQQMEAFIYSRKCQTLGVPRQSRGFTHDYYAKNLHIKPFSKAGRAQISHYGSEYKYFLLVISKITCFSLTGSLFLVPLEKMIIDEKK